MVKVKMIGGIPIDRWKRAFAEAADIAISKDYFSDILFFDLYPNTSEEEEENEELVDEVYNTQWKFVDEAFKEIFGVSRNEL